MIFLYKMGFLHFHTCHFSLGAMKMEVLKQPLQTCPVTSLAPLAPSRSFDQHDELWSVVKSLKL